MEKKAACTNVPTWGEYEEAADRERVRVLESAYAKMLGEEDPRQPLSEEERGLLVGDTPEQRERDADIIRRYQEVHSVGADLDALAEKAYQKLGGVGRAER